MSKLQVQSSQGARDRPGMIVLNKRPFDPGGTIFFRMVRFEEVAAPIAVYVGLDHYHAGNRGGHEAHGQLSCSIRRIRYCPYALVSMARASRATSPAEM